MIDVTSELDNLRNRLVLKGLDESQVAHICDTVALSIRDTVIDIMADAMEDAVNESGANNHNFVKEVMATRDGSLFKITTSSGRTDFSEPPFPMLPKLLENAKVSATGSRYKVIPMRKKDSDSSLPKTIENAIKQINQQREIMKAEKEARQELARDPLSSIKTIKIQETDDKDTRFNRSSSTATEFRTASDKQDANSKWVYPAKKADMTNALDAVNLSLQDRIDSAIRDIMSKFGGI